MGILLFLAYISSKHIMKNKQYIIFFKTAVGDYDAKYIAIKIDPTQKAGTQSDQSYKLNNRSTGKSTYYHLTTKRSLIF